MHQIVKFETNAKKIVKVEGVGQHNLIHGKNFSGKTAALNGIKLALFGAADDVGIRPDESKASYLLRELIPAGDAELYARAWLEDGSLFEYTLTGAGKAKHKKPEHVRVVWLGDELACLQKSTAFDFAAMLARWVPFPKSASAPDMDDPIKARLKEINSGLTGSLAQRLLAIVALAKDQKKLNADELKPLEIVATKVPEVAAKLQPQIEFHTAEIEAYDKVAKVATEWLFRLVHANHDVFKSILESVSTYKRVDFEIDDSGRLRVGFRRGDTLQPAVSGAEGMEVFATWAAFLALHAHEDDLLIWVSSDRWLDEDSYRLLLDIAGDMHAQVFFQAVQRPRGRPRKTWTEIPMGDK